MKVWIEVLTPKQALFFEPLYRALKREGHETLITTRVYREAEQSLELGEPLLENSSRALKELQSSRT
jgi:predicted glycosyltransferase